MTWKLQEDVESDWNWQPVTAVLPCGVPLSTDTEDDDLKRLSRQRAEDELAEKIRERDDPCLTFLTEPEDGAYDGDDPSLTYSVEETMEREGWKSPSHFRLPADNCGTERVVRLTHADYAGKWLLEEVVKTRGYAPTTPRTPQRLRQLRSLSRKKTEFVECTTVFYMTNRRPRQRSGRGLGLDDLVSPKLFMNEVKL
jgi:hypothetical protein